MPIGIFIWGIEDFKGTVKKAYCCFIEIFASPYKLASNPKELIDGHREFFKRSLTQTDKKPDKKETDQKGKEINPPPKTEQAKIKFPVSEVEAGKKLMQKVLNSVLNGLESTTHPLGKLYFIKDPNDPAIYRDNDYPNLKDKFKKTFEDIINSLNQENFFEVSQDFSFKLETCIGKLLNIKDALHSNDKEKLEEANKNFQDRTLQWAILTKQGGST